LETIIIDLDLETEWWQQEQQERAAFNKLFVSKTGDELLKHFFGWVVKRGWWDKFWGAFRSDGIMNWNEFEEFVHWEGRWTGEKRRVFEEMARHCETLQDGSGTKSYCPYLTASGVLDLKRWWEDSLNPGKSAAAKLDNFKWIFAEHYGNLGCAWRAALDPEDTGSCCFLVFCRVCNQLGMRRNLKSIWTEITGGNPHRKIFFHDWDPVGARLVSRFTVALSIKYGGMQEGWSRVIRNAGGHLHTATFIEVCDDLGIDMHDAKWLFAVMCVGQNRFLTEFDRVRFLSHWDPGQPGDPNMTLEELQLTTTLPEKKKAAKKKEGAPTEEKEKPFNFVVELNKEEHQQYLQRLRTHLLTIGQDEEATAARLKRKAKQEQEEKTTAKVQEVLQRPLVCRHFNNDELLEDPDIAAHATKDPVIAPHAISEVASAQT